MASNPGLFTEWPWKRLGNFKYVLLAPLLVHTVYSSMKRKEKGEDLDMFEISIIPIQVLRVIHTQFWITLSRFQTGRSTNNRIVSKSLEFEQVDRERNWDDQIVLTTFILYTIKMMIPGADKIPWWDTRGILLTIFIHSGPVEFLYYWFHRALHHHFLYSRYHSHHHASIVTEPITAVIHPFAEEVVYFILFSIPLLTIVFTETASIVAFGGYMLYIDFMNYLGHCNFEMVPNWMFRAFPPLKYLMYTPSFHSLHHTQFRTNYSLFMPFYDHLYGTVDKSTDDLYRHQSLKSVKAKECTETTQVVHLTHPTSLLSIYQLRVGFASLASRPYGSMLPYAWLMWPLNGLSLMLTWFCGSAFAVEKISMGKLEMQTWVVPRYGFQYSMSWERHTINEMIERAIRDAEKNGIRVLSLGLLNQDQQLNKNGELYVKKNPNLKVKISDGSCLAVAAVLNSIPKGTKQVIIRGKLSKVAFVVAKTLLCQRSIQIITIRRKDYEKLKLQLQLPANIIENDNLLILSNAQLPSTKVWLVGEGVSAEEQRRAVKGTTFIPFSQFPPREHRRGDCVYHLTPSMIVPKSLENIHCCENWLPRRVMSAWRVAGIVHALEGWNVDEVGDMVVDHDKAWKAALSHGFLASSP